MNRCGCQLFGVEKEACSGESDALDLSSRISRDSCGSGKSLILTELRLFIWTMATSPRGTHGLESRGRCRALKQSVDYPHALFVGREAAPLSAGCRRALFIAVERG